MRVVHWPPGSDMAKRVLEDPNSVRVTGHARLVQLALILCVTNQSSRSRSPSKAAAAADIANRLRRGLGLADAGGGDSGLGGLLGEQAPHSPSSFSSTAGNGKRKPHAASSLYGHTAAHTWPSCLGMRVATEQEGDDDLVALVLAGGNRRRGGMRSPRTFDALRLEVEPYALASSVVDHVLEGC